MPFNIYFPLEHQPADVRTSNDLIDQVWMEFIMLRHTSNLGHCSPWIEQARSYFLDARKSDWRSGGLLYYYSFLNLAKAYLVKSEKLTDDTLKTTAVHHGLSANPQNIERLVDFEFVVHPPCTQCNTNLFSSLYESITKQSWPFKEKITVQLSTFVPYMFDIAAEAQQLFGIDYKLSDVQSMLRIAGNNAWFELLTPTRSVSDIKENIPGLFTTEFDGNTVDEQTKSDWLTALNRTSSTRIGQTFLRSDTVPDVGNARKELLESIREQFKGLARPHVFDDPSNPTWMFVPRLPLESERLVWHPLLSNYLFAFVASTVLRYYPHLTFSDSPSSLITQAWCNQSSATTLRYFLMEFTDPPLRLGRY